MSAARSAEILRFMIARRPLSGTRAPGCGAARTPPAGYFHCRPEAVQADDGANEEPVARHCAAAGRRSCVRRALQRVLALEAVIAGEAADQLLLHPVLQDAAEVLARDARHGGEVALADFLANEDASGADVLAECGREHK